jgi:hypothetical protein
MIERQLMLFVTYFSNCGDRIDVTCTRGTGHDKERLRLINHSGLYW